MGAGRSVLPAGIEINIESQDRYRRLSPITIWAWWRRQRKWEQAEAYYQHALQISIEYQDRYAQARTYHQLGGVAQEQRQSKHAEEYYRQALQIKIEYQDRYAQANTYHKLGMVAQEQRKWEQAEAYYQQAFQIYLSTRIGMRRLAPTTIWVWWPRSSGSGSRRSSTTSKPCRSRLSTRIAMQALTYHQLGRVAQEQRQWEQARDYYSARIGNVCSF